MKEANTVTTEKKATYEAPKLIELGAMQVETLASTSSQGQGRGDDGNEGSNN